MRRSDVNGVNYRPKSSLPTRYFVRIRSSTTTISAGPPVRSKADCWRTIWINILTKTASFWICQASNLTVAIRPPRMVAVPLAIRAVKRVRQLMRCFYPIIRGLCCLCPPPKRANMARATPHDLFEIQVLFDKICGLLKAAGIDLKVVSRC